MTTTRNRLPAGRGICADCGTDSALTAAGDVIVHGPRDLRCTGSGRPPRPPAPPLFVPAVGTPADTATEPSAAVEPASAPDPLPPSAYAAGDRVVRPYSGWVGDVEHVGPHHATGETVVTVVWDHGAATTHGGDSIGQIRRVDRVGRPEAEPVAEVAAPPPVLAYTVLDEDDGEIDGGAVTPRAETLHADIPAEDEGECKHHRAATAFAAYLGGLLKSLDEPSPECVDADADDAAVVGHALGCQIRKRLTGGAIPEPSLLGMAQRSRIEQLEADAARRLPDGEPQRRRISVLEDQLDASREEVARLLQVVRDTVAERDLLSREAAASAADARRSRDTLRGALDLIGRLGPA